MQYSVRHRRRLRQTGETGVPRTQTTRGTGVADAVTPRPAAEPLKEVVPASVFERNWLR